MCMRDKNLPFSHTTRWLAVRLSHMGDVVLTTGVLASWGERFGCRFSVVTRREWEPLFDGHPFVEAVHGLDAADLPLANLVPIFRRLAVTYRGWGLLDLHGTLRSRLLAMLWQGPVRRYPKMGFERRVFLRTGSKAMSAALCRHSVTQRYALALEATPPDAAELLPRLWLTPAEREAARSRLDAIYGGGARPVAVHPYAAHPHKTWAAERWQEFVGELDARSIPWVAVGKGPRIFPGRREDLSSQCSLRESAAVLAECRALVTGDSGPMHLASAVGTPVVALFGPTTREWGFYPAGPHDQVVENDSPCRPCSLHGQGNCAREGICLSSISCARVLAALKNTQ